MALFVVIYDSVGATHASPAFDAVQDYNVKVTFFLL